LAAPSPSAKPTSATPTALPPSERYSEKDPSGRPTDGRPLSMWPTMATPSGSSSSITSTPKATATSEPGTTGASRRSPMTSASDTTPIASVAACVPPRLPSRSQSSSKKSPGPVSTPNSFGSCPAMMVSARPTMKPLRTGSEMKLARNPSRSTPAISATAPVTIASAAVRPKCGATAAADRAAVADIGPTIRCRELPSSAYSSRAGGAAYKPTTGDTPAIDA
jgi:hypothetical protein